MVYLIDDEYLFTGDTIWFGADGGYSFISTLAEDNKLSVRSLETLEKNLKKRPNGTIKIITGHTGWTDDLTAPKTIRGRVMAYLNSVSLQRRNQNSTSFGPASSWRII